MAEEKKEENSTKTLIEASLEAAKRLEQANLKMEELLKKQEELTAQKILGGRSEAGITPKIKTEEDLIKEEADIYLKAAGLKK